MVLIMETDESVSAFVFGIIPTTEVVGYCKDTITHRFDGNSLKKEKAPDGSKDENVFDIQQGVAVCFMIKYKK